MRHLTIQNYLQFYSLIVVSRTVKKQKYQKKVHIFRDHWMISVFYEFFCNSPNSHNLKQIKMYHYQNSLLKNTHWHFPSLTSPLYPVHVCLLFFPCIFSIFILQELDRQHCQFRYL